MTYLAKLEYRRVMSETMPRITPSAPIKEPLIDFYLDWVNNYATIERLAADYNLDLDTALKLINIGANFYKETAEQDSE